MQRMIFLLLLWCVGASPLAVAQNEDALWRALKKPGAVVVLRHSYAPGRFDPPDSVINDCSTQRNLDADGRAQAKAIGETFRDKGIMVGEVLSSPKCRTRDTGLIAFGRVENWSALMGARSNPALANQKIAQIYERMQAHTSDKPMILITHGSIVRALLGRIIPMGEFAVLLPVAGESGKDAYQEAGALFIKAPVPAE